MLELWHHEVRNAVMVAELSRRIPPHRASDWLEASPQHQIGPRFRPDSHRRLPRRPPPPSPAPTRW